jgi:hypothetical protein
MVRRLAVGFLVFWLWGWWEGEFFAAKHAMASTTPWPFRAFLFIWLAGWTVGGLGAACFAIRFARRPRQETLLIESGAITWTPPYGWMLPCSKWKMIISPTLWFGGKTPNDVRLLREEVTAILFVRSDPDSSEQLILQRGAARYMIGSTLSEDEGRWLCVLLNQWKTSAG